MHDVRHTQISTSHAADPTIWTDPTNRRTRFPSSQAAQAQISSAAARVSRAMESSDVRQTEELQQRERQENRLSELSAVVGQYEAARVADSATIADLQDECADLRAQLDDMVQQHAERGAGDGSSSAAGEGSSSHDNAAGRIATLEESVGKLKSLLFLANQRLAESGPVAGGSNASEGAWSYQPYQASGGSNAAGDATADAWDDNAVLAGEGVAPPTWQQGGGDGGMAASVAPDVLRARQEGDALYAHVQRLVGAVRAMRSALQQARDGESDAVGKIEILVADRVRK